MLLRHPHQKAIERLSLLICGFTNYIVEASLAILPIVADIVEKLFKFNVVEVFFFAELAVLEDASEGLNEFSPHIDDRLTLYQLLRLLLYDP